MDEHLLKLIETLVGIDEQTILSHRGDIKRQFKQMLNFDFNLESEHGFRFEKGYHARIEEREEGCELIIRHDWENLTVCSQKKMTVNACFLRSFERSPERRSTSASLKKFLSNKENQEEISQVRKDEKSGKECEGALPKFHSCP